MEGFGGGAGLDDGRVVGEGRGARPHGPRPRTTGTYRAPAGPRRTPHDRHPARRARRHLRQQPAPRPRRGAHARADVGAGVPADGHRDRPAPLLRVGPDLPPAGAPAGRGRRPAGGLRPRRLRADRPSRPGGALDRACQRLHPRLRRGPARGAARPPRGGPGGGDRDLDGRRHHDRVRPDPPPPRRPRRAVLRATDRGRLRPVVGAPGPARPGPGRDRDAGGAAPGRHHRPRPGRTVLARRVPGRGRRRRRARPVPPDRRVGPGPVVEVDRRRAPGPAGAPARARGRGGPGHRRRRHPRPAGPPARGPPHRHRHRRSLRGDRLRPRGARRGRP